MARVFARVRGSFRAMDVGNITSSIIKLNGVSDKLKSGSGILVSNFNFSKNEKTSIIQCFNDVNHIYAFGHDPEGSMFQVTFIAFMSKCSDYFSDTGNLKTLVDKYDAKRVSKSRSTITATFGKGLSVVGILTNLNAAVFDAEMNALSCTFSGKIVSSR
jgi:hypothetical protein